jgi:hypothetical protein
MTPADKLLSRLGRVKATGPGRWMASCPTREDKHPSLAIRELDDGRVLLHDFGGEDVATIMSSLGLELCDLFPAAPGGHHKPARRPFNAADVLALVAVESTVAVLVCADVLRQHTVSDADFNRLMTAAQRLGDAAEVCRAYR